MKANEALNRVYRAINDNVEAILQHPDRQGLLLARVHSNGIGESKHYGMGVFRDPNGEPVYTEWDSPAELLMAMEELSPVGWGTECMSDDGHYVETEWDGCTACEDTGVEEYQHPTWNGELVTLTRPCRQCHYWEWRDSL